MFLILVPILHVVPTQFALFLGIGIDQHQAATMERNLKRKWVEDGSECTDERMLASQHSLTHICRREVLKQDGQMVYHYTQRKCVVCACYNASQYCSTCGIGTVLCSSRKKGCHWKHLAEVEATQAWSSMKSCQGQPYSEPDTVLAKKLPDRQEDEKPSPVLATPSLRPSVTTSVDCLLACLMDRQEDDKPSPVLATPSSRPSVTTSLDCLVACLMVEMGSEADLGLLGLSAEHVIENSTDGFLDGAPLDF